MRIAECIAFFVPHGLQKLVDPDRGVHCETFAVEGGEWCWAGAGLEDRPEGSNSHGEDRLGMMSRVLK